MTNRQKSKKKKNTKKLVKNDDNFQKFTSPNFFRTPEYFSLEFYGLLNNFVLKGNVKKFLFFCIFPICTEI